jgi:hypothetical protein
MIRLGLRRSALTDLLVDAFRCRSWDDHVVAVLPPNEGGNQRFVILRALGQRVHHSEPVEAGGGKTRSRRATTSFEKVSS